MGDGPVAALDPRAFRRTVGRFATGVTVITVRAGETVHGMTANSFTSVSLEPLLLLVCIDRRARMAALIEAAGEFAVNVLSDRQEELSRHFAGSKSGPEPASLRFDRTDPERAPIIHGCLAAIRCRVERVVDGGDHIIVIGQVVAFRADEDEDPLLYFGGRYRWLSEMEPAGPAAEVWNNDAVRIYHEAWAEPVEEAHPMA